MISGFSAVELSYESSKSTVGELTQSGELDQPVDCELRDGIVAGSPEAYNGETARGRDEGAFGLLELWDSVAKAD